MRAAPAIPIHSIVAKTSVIQRAHCNSAVYGVLLFANAGPSGLGWCVCGGTGECTCACVGYEFCHSTVDSNLPCDA